MLPSVEHTSYVAFMLRSGPPRKRPRPLEEALEAGNGVGLKFSESFAVDNQNLVLLQVSIWNLPSQHSSCLLLRVCQEVLVASRQVLSIE